MRIIRHGLLSFETTSLVIMFVLLVLYSLAKEKMMYEKEVVEQERKIEKMKAEGKDEYDIKKQVTLYSLWSHSQMS